MENEFICGRIDSYMWAKNLVGKLTCGQIDMWANWHVGEITVNP